VCVCVCVIYIYIYYTHTHTGARLCGFSSYQVNGGGWVKKDKHWGKNLKLDQFAAGIQEFFHNGDRIRRRIAARMYFLLRTH